MRAKFPSLVAGPTLKKVLEEITVKRLSCMLLVLCFVVTLAGCGSSGDSAKQAAKPIELRFAHMGVPGEIYTVFADELAKQAQERTQGRVIIKVYGNGQLGGVSELADGVKNGTIDIGLYDFATLAKFVPNLAVFNAPYVFKSPEHIMKAADPYSSKVMMKMNEELIQKAGIRIIANCYRGAREISSTFPIYSPDDLKGKKMRGVPLEIWVSMIKGMGAIPTPVEYAELAAALATGTVVAQENPINNIYSSKMYEVTPFISMTDHMQSAQTIFINEKSWQKISKEDRAVIEKICQELAVKSIEQTKASDTDLIAKLKEKNVKIITEKDGLKVDEFRKNVLVQINKDFPQWNDLIKEIQAM